MQNPNPENKAIYVSSWELAQQQATIDSEMRQANLERRRQPIETILKSKSYAEKINLLANSDERVCFTVYADGSLSELTPLERGEPYELSLSDSIRQPSTALEGLFYEYDAGEFRRRNDLTMLNYPAGTVSGLRDLELLVMLNEKYDGLTPCLVSKNDRYKHLFLCRIDQQSHFKPERLHWLKQSATKEYTLLVLMAAGVGYAEINMNGCPSANTKQAKAAGKHLIEITL